MTDIAITQIDEIIYLPKFDQQAISDHERVAINMFVSAGKDLNIPVRSYADYSLEKQLTNVAVNGQHGSSNVLFVSFGGDGTMLTAMREAADHQNGTVLGINYGNLGFLTSYDKTSIDGVFPTKLKTFFSKMLKSITINSLGNAESDPIANMLTAKDSRLVIAGKIEKSISTGIISNAANEFLITTPTRSSPLEYEIYINNQHIATQSGDGVIISTPTGTTAYAMSAGGSIMSPNSRGMQIVPLAPHTLSSRPVIISENDTITIKSRFTNRNKAVDVRVDGQLLAHTTPDNSPNGEFEITINKKALINIWRPTDWNFFDVLSEKMGWGK